MLTRGDYKTPNEDLYNKIQRVYSEYFIPETEYKHGAFKYTNAPNYGYVGFEKREYSGEREFTADEYVAFSGTLFFQNLTEASFLTASERQF